MLEPKGVGIPPGWRPRLGPCVKAGVMTVTRIPVGLVPQAKGRSATFRLVGLRRGDIRDRVIPLGVAAIGTWRRDHPRTRQDVLVALELGS
jgi:hypothetical protein